MSTKDFRSAVTGAVLAWAAANFPAMPIIYENGPVPDEDTIGPIFLDLEIRWYSAKTRTIGEGGLGQHKGSVSAQVFYRDSMGTGLTDDVIDSLKSALRPQRIGGGILQFPQRTAPGKLKGWYSSGLLFPFSLDE